MPTFRTDLAIERGSLDRGGQVPGVTMHIESHEPDIHLTRVCVDENGARSLEKEPGTYTTLECDALAQRDPEAVRACARLLAEELKTMLEAFGITKESTALVVGLGNRAITPDALGPLSAGKVLVTRHLIAAMPDTIDRRLSPVCAISPGVLGVTGVETMEMIRGVVAHVKPAVVICIDALAARSTRRICTSIQIADSGLSPGGGVGNRRMMIDRKTLGVPVISIGVPMVVYASTISHDVLEALMEHMKDMAGEVHEVHELLTHFGEEFLDELIRDAAQNAVGDLVVTPKDVDDTVQTLAHTLSLGINLSLHPELTEEEILSYLA